MSIKISCPHCGQHYEVDDEYSGVTVECEACRECFVVDNRNNYEHVKQPIDSNSRSAQAHKQSCKKIFTLIGFLALLAIMAVSAWFYVFRTPLPDVLGGFSVVEVIDRENEIGIVALRHFSNRNDAEKTLNKIIEMAKIKYELPFTLRDGVYSVGASLETDIEKQEIKTKQNAIQIKIDMLNEQVDSYKQCYKKLKKMCGYHYLNKNEAEEAKALIAELKEIMNPTNFVLMKNRNGDVVLVEQSENENAEKFKNALVKLLSESAKLAEENFNLADESFLRAGGMGETGGGALRMSLAINNDNQIIFVAKVTGTMPRERLQSFCKKFTWYDESRKLLGFDN